MVPYVRYVSPCRNGDQQIASDAPPSEVARVRCSHSAKRPRSRHGGRGLQVKQQKASRDGNRTDQQSKPYR